jgi:hypothetical protein
LGTVRQRTPLAGGAAFTGGFVLAFGSKGLIFRKTALDC